jgi:hypothetical protein
MKKTTNKIFAYINLKKAKKIETCMDNVTSNISFRGSNLWILACAVVASIGLNVNSTAVIIGAMLISPLMGPIIGAGFGLGFMTLIYLKDPKQPFDCYSCWFVSTISFISLLKTHSLSYYRELHQYLRYPYRFFWRFGRSYRNNKS